MVSASHTKGFLTPGVEQRRIIGVNRDRNAGLAQFVDRMFCNRAVNSHGDVGNRADTQRNLTIGKQVDQFRILDCPHSVVDPVDAQQLTHIGGGLLQGIDPSMRRI